MSITACSITHTKIISSSLILRGTNKRTKLPHETDRSMRELIHISHICINHLYPIQLPIAEVDQQIDADNSEIDKVDRQHVAEIVAEDFGCNACNIAGHDQQNKGDAHSFGGVGLDVTVDVQRPGKTKANEHKSF